MSTVWAQRREDLGSDCLVSPDVFHQRVDRLCAFGVPYQHVLETETGQRNLHLYLQGLLSHLPGKNAALLLDSGVLCSRVVREAQLIFKAIEK